MRRLLPARAAALAVLGASLALVHPLTAQTRGGNISGIVRTSEDQSPIMSASVRVSSPARGAVTDERGRYTLRDLPAGRYQVVITALGREPSRDSVQVTARGTTTHDVSMKQGSLMLSTVIVSATRSEIEAKQVAGTVNVLGPEHIQTSAARETQDLLREMPGVELARTSSLVGGSAQIVSIRGVDEGRTSVLFDGVPVNDAWGEWIVWGRVPKGMLDRVEVVEGGASSLYGANGGIGGIISFFSRPLAPGAFNITVDGGSRSARHTFVSAGIPIFGALTANVSGDYQEGGGYTLLDSAKRGVVDVASSVIQRNAYARLNYAPDAKWSAFATGHLFGDSRNTGTPLAFTNRDFQHVNAGFDHSAVLGGAFGVRVWNGLQNEKQRGTTVRTGRAAEDSTLNALIPSHDWGTTLQWNRQSVLGLETVGLGADYRKMSGNYDETDYGTCPSTTCGAITRKVVSGGAQVLSGAYLQAIAAPFSALRIEATARVDHWINSDGQSVDNLNGTVNYQERSTTAFDPRLGIRYQLHPTFALHAAGYKAFRAPNLAELYRKTINAAGSQILLPNPELAAESGVGREVGFDFQPGTMLQVKGTYYVADYRDFNAQVTTQTGPPQIRQRLNVARAKSRGIESYVAIRPLQPLFISGSVNWDDARVVTAAPGSAFLPGAPFQRVPSPRQTIRAMYTTPLVGEAAVIWRHEGQTTTLQGLPLDPFTVVDATYRRELVPGLRMFVAGENLGNVRYMVNQSGTGAAALISYGMPRTLRLGMDAFRY